MKGCSWKIELLCELLAAAYLSQGCNWACICGGDSSDRCEQYLLCRSYGLNVQSTGLAFAGWQMLLPSSPNLLVSLCSLKTPRKQEFLPLGKREVSLETE